MGRNYKRKGEKSAGSSPSRSEKDCIEEADSRRLGLRPCRVHGLPGLDCVI